jgi:hypothetical protein
MAVGQASGLPCQPLAGSSKVLVSAHLDTIYVRLDVALRFQVQHVHWGQQGLARSKGSYLYALQNGPACFRPAGLLCFPKAVDGLHGELRSRSRLSGESLLGM